MSPLFRDGDYFVCCRWPYAYLKISDQILVKHPEYGFILKNIQQKSDLGLRLEGSNPQSLSSEKMGLISRQQVIAKVIWHIKKPATYT